MTGEPQASPLSGEGSGAAGFVGERGKGGAMRLRFRTGLALAVCLGLAVLQGWAQTGASDDLTTGGGNQDPQWVAWAGKTAAYRLNRQKQLQFEKEMAAKEAKEAKENPRPTPRSLADERQKAKEAWLRRMEVCDRLTRIAGETNDLKLLDEVQQLQDRAFAIYQKQSGLSALPVSAAPKFVPEELPPPLQSPDTGVILPTPPATSKKSAARREGNP